MTDPDFKAFQFRLGGEIRSFNQPVVMGIVNISPDSFYSKSTCSSVSSVLLQIEEMMKDGAEIIDLGAVSSRPGSISVSPDEEWNRLKPVLVEIRKSFPGICLSLDTYRETIVQQSFDLFGSFIVNDIFAGRSSDSMFQRIANLGLPYIPMHMKGEPENMQNQPEYDDVVMEIIRFFASLLNKLALAGIRDVMIDPGFGFGKSIDHNYSILNCLADFKILERPVVVGLSRKSMIYKALNSSPEDALTGTIALQTLALLNGASVIRCHDVKPAKDVIRLLPYIQNNQS